MLFSARSKVGGLLSLLGIVTIISAFVFNAMFFHGTATRAAGRQAYSVTKGILTPSKSIDKSNSTSTFFSKGTRHLHQGNNQASKSPSVVGSQLGTTISGSLLQKFNGTSSLDSEKTNFGAEFEPPDQGLCVGNGFVVEPVNSAYRIFRPDGTTVAGPFNVNRLFNDGFKQFTSDPRCYFDKSTNTWFAIVLFLNSKFTIGRLDLSVNTTGDPTTPWTTYRIDATDPFGPGCPCFGDQPRLGIDQFNIYISTDEFSILGPQFNGPQLYAISKSDLVALANSVHFVHFGNLSIAGTVPVSVQPAITTGASNAEYFMNSLDPNGTGDNRVGVWAMTNQNAVSQGNFPTLSNVIFTSEPYVVPPGAIQKGAGSLLDSGDDRMQQVQFINGNLWGALDTGVTIPNDTATRAGAAWFKVQPRLDASGTVIRAAQLVKQGYVSSLGNYLLYPAIQASPNGTAAIILTLSGSNIFPSVVYTKMQAGGNAFGAIHIALFGKGSYFRKSTRWGDYSWATLDPDTNNFWMATEYIPPESSQTTDGKQNWGTGVIEVSANS
jgi:hypothetical protein